MKKLIARTLTVKGIQAVLISDGVDNTITDVITFDEQNPFDVNSTESIVNDFSIYLRFAGQKVYQFNSELTRMIDDICYKYKIKEW